MRPDPQGFGPPWPSLPATSGSQPGRTEVTSAQRKGPVHTQTGEPAAEDSKVPALLQMEVITPLPTSPFPSAAQISPEAASASSSSWVRGPCAAQGPLWRTAPLCFSNMPILLKRAWSPSITEAGLAGPRQMEGLFPRPPAGSPESSLKRQRGWCSLQEVQGDALSPGWGSRGLTGRYQQDLRSQQNP